MNQPTKQEYNPYHQGYIDTVTEPELLGALEAQIGEIEKFWGAITEDKADYSYAEGKWTIKGVLSHLLDTERVYSYRALRFSKGDKTVLPGYDQDEYVAGNTYGHLTLRQLIDELVSLRKANVIFFRNLPVEAETRSGNANGFDISVRAIACVLVGHIRHHSNIVAERYL